MLKSRVLSIRKAAFTLVEVLITTIVIGVSSIFIFRALFIQLNALKTVTLRLNLMPHFHKNRIEAMFERQTSGGVGKFSNKNRGEILLQDTPVRFETVKKPHGRYSHLNIMQTAYSWQNNSKKISIKRDLFLINPSMYNKTLMSDE